LRLRKSRTLASTHPLRATEIVEKEANFYTNTSFGTPGGITVSNMENENMLNVTLDALPDQLKELIVTATNEYQEKCLLSFSKNRDKKVI
jgi:hypothetical protein